MNYENPQAPQSGLRYLQRHSIREVMERMIQGLSVEQPDDPSAWMVSYLQKSAIPSHETVVIASDAKTCDDQMDGPPMVPLTLQIAMKGKKTKKLTENATETSKKLTEKATVTFVTLTNPREVDFVDNV